MKHYHVLIGLRGLYMPNTNHVCSTLVEARGLAKETAENFRDEDTSVRRINADYYTFGPRRGGHNECIEVSVCDETRCRIEED